MRRQKKSSGTAGFSLIEVVIALAVFSFSIVGIMGMIVAGLQSSRNSIDEMQAVNLARTLQADFRLATSQSTTPTPLTATPLYTLSTNPTLASGASEPTPIVTYISDNNQIVASAAAARYRLTIQQLPLAQYTSTTGTFTTTCNSLQPSSWLLSISWPAASSTPTGSVEVIVSVPR